MSNLAEQIMDYILDVTQDFLPKKNVFLMREFLCKNIPKLDDNNILNNIHIICPECGQTFVRQRCFMKHVTSYHTKGIDEGKKMLCNALIKSIETSNGYSKDMSSEELAKIVEECVSI